MNGHLENELRESLARIQPPEGLADRIVANLPERSRRTQYVYWFMTAAAAIALVFLAHFEHAQHETRRRAAQVQQEVAFALRLTAEKLAMIDGHLKRSAPEVQLNREKGEL